MTQAIGTATDTIAAIHAGTSTVEAWHTSCFDRITKREPEVRAWASLRQEGALCEARALDRANPSTKPLAGMPLGVKDVILTRDLPTEYNSPIYQGFVPNMDAACVALLRAAGAIPIGKTETVEFAAAVRLAPTHNPLNLAHTPGGSSSGSAAAVADGHVPVALGTQTGGSVIRPASFCGICAIKPTWSRISREGIKMYAPSLDTLGWFARSVDDLSLVYDSLVPDPALPLDAPEPGQLRIAICHTPFPDCADLATRRGLARVGALLEACGVSVSTLDLPPEFDGIDDSARVVMRAEGRAAFLPEYRTDYADLNDHFRALVENVEGIGDDDLRRAYDHAAQCRARFDMIASDYDAVLTYSVPGEAPRGLSNNGSAAFNSLWTLLHVPCVTVPVMQGTSGLPVGLTVTGPRFADRAVMAVARVVHAAVAAEEREAIVAL
ncbi:amidase [Tropicimonas isoalkanivorans]|uniref:Asp-tRNAAsn/Glu-tRNAGln amidotransferase A subunit n=1 Tax=Tropicimonas isoalkanivorans TaxID=441112 RepID=A0A1I1KQ41_9RHOB|nr:amidase [Tropicimonas isoalkanivorans]SFC63024.1 Asp-tRNAAsn/Glu-tRNAGln amidotransferase A subunit [Tropicimonas isoalkanivorans]